MSTKTTFKRIALVAVASLGFGMLSVAPSSAANNATVPTMAITSPTTANSGTTSVPIKQSTAIVADLILTAGVAYTDSGDGTNMTYVVTNPQGTVITSSATFTAVAAPVAGITATVSGAVISVRATAAATALPAGTIIGTVTIPASATAVAGTYQVTSSLTAVNAAGGTTDTDTGGQQMDGTTSVARGQIFVSGTSVTQGITRGLNGTATTGNVATVTWFTPTHTNSSVYRITVTGVGSVSTIAQGAGTATSITPISGVTGNWNSGAIYTTAAATTTETATIQLSSTVAGAQVVTVQTADATTGNLTTVATSTVTWGAAPTISGSLSTVFAAGGSARATTLETTTLRLPSTAGVTMSATATSGVSIAITALDGDGNALVGQAVTATIAGPGLLSITSGNNAATTGTVRSVSLTASNQAAANQSTIGVTADGTRGVGTITITVGGVVFTKVVNFYGAVATLTATQGVSVMRSGRTATSTVTDFTLGGVDPAAVATAAITQATATNISIVAKDVDGNVVPLSTAPTADISNAAAIATVNIAACTNANLATSVCAAGDGTWIANTVAAVGGVSGAASTVTFKTPHPTTVGAFISTAAVPFTLGGSRTGGTVTMSLDKSTYLPGERMIITYTAKDSAGNPVHDWASTGTPTANKSIVGLAGGVYVNGTLIYGDGSTELTYAPTAPGAFTVTLATGTSSTATISATATVSDDAATTAANAATEASNAASDAAAEATDAANAATDAANAAAEAADAATAAAQDAADAVAALSTSVSAMVSDLKKQITALTNLVIKIQKKVKA